MRHPLHKENHIIWVFLAFIVTAFVIMTYTTRQRHFEIDTSAKLFFGLYKISKTHGLERYQKEKLALRKQIISHLKNPISDEQEAFAASVALYLFPDALPDSNLEKSVAMELWAPLESAIEREPNTEKARAWFEEMRANIWNYESPGGKSSQLSDAANQVLKIYNGMSSK